VEVGGAAISVLARSMALMIVLRRSQLHLGRILVCLIPSHNALGLIAIIAGDQNFHAVILESNCARSGSFANILSYLPVSLIFLKILRCA
jgi:hypothetical protein